MKHEGDPYSSMNYNVSLPLALPQTVPAWETSAPALPAFFRTTWQMLLHPGRTLSGLGFPGYSSLLAFSMPWLVLSSIIFTLYQDSWSPGAEFVVSTLLLVPLSALFGLLLSAGVFHFILLLVGGAQNGWRMTFRAAAYLSAGACLLLLPWLGSLLYLLWSLLAMFPALAASHGISRSRVLGGWLAFVALLLLIGVVVSSIVGWAFLLGLREMIINTWGLKL
jgi:hypothetical protein